MGTPLAVQGCTFKFYLDPGMGTISGGTAAPAAGSLPSSDIAVNNKGVWFKEIKVQLSGTSVTLTTPPAGAVSPSSVSGTQTPAVITITGTADNVLEGDVNTGTKAVLKGDKGSGTVSWLFPGPQGTQVPGTANVNIEVDDPGQTDAEAS